MLLVVSLEGVVACTVRAREQGRTGQNRFPRGTEGARLSEWCRELCGKSRSAWRMSSVGGTGRAVRVPRVIQSMAPKTKKEMSGIPSEWVTAQPRIRSAARRDQAGLASNQDSLVSGHGARGFVATELAESVCRCSSVARSGECAALDGACEPPPPSTS